MKKVLIFIFIVFFFFGCTHPDLSQTSETIEKSSFEELPSGFKQENFDEVVDLFKKNCEAKRTLKVYPQLCQKVQDVNDSKAFILENFQPYQLINDKDEINEGLLTGYYLASIHASLEKSDVYKYPIYETPPDLVSVNLSEIYPELKHYRLRGRVVDGKLIPYYSREESSEIKAPVICYCNSKIDKFFLEVQGSGKVYLDDNSTMYIGYDNQNGYKYRSIGRYLVDKNEIPLEDISMQSIRKWLDEHPQRIDEVLNYNDSMVFFRKKAEGAFGALGLQLTPKRSIAVDRRYIMLGSMIYLDADLEDGKISKIVFAQDTGGAIRGSVRADFFTGFGEEAQEIAGKLKAPLKMWVFLPKEGSKEDNE